MNYAIPVNESCALNLIFLNSNTTQPNPLILKPPCRPSPLTPEPQQARTYTLQEAWCPVNTLFSKNPHKSGYIRLTRI